MYEHMAIISNMGYLYLYNDFKKQVFIGKYPVFICNFIESFS